MNTSKSGMTVRFWGVCGSVPAPLTGKRVEDKIIAALQRAYEVPLPPAPSVQLGVTDEEYRKALRDWLHANVPFHTRYTHGGNTTCVEVRCDDILLVLDMGTGIRELGLALMPELLNTRKLHGHILQSHLHHDHIQGLPFWKPLYMPRSMFDCRFTFAGGKDWDSELQSVLKNQMRPPVFPVDFGELAHTAMRIDFETVWDGWTKEIQGQRGPIKILARKLNHPQDTFGYRIEYAGRTVAFTTDHEPYAGIPIPLRRLAQDADLWITDCQYSHDTFLGKTDGTQRLGWGHSFPEYIASVAREAKPKRIVTTHHDPESSDEHIVRIADVVAECCEIETVAAYEGLCIEMGESC
jgi:phosphoribosyl 1,2-cyclic phosphodiesterase